MIYYLRKPGVAVNLAVMSYMWASISFCFYMISFQLKYLPGNIYQNTMASQTSQLIAVLCGGSLFKIFKIRLSFALSYVIGLIGGLLILILG
jgi:hypothetical protein